MRSRRRSAFLSFVFLTFASFGPFAGGEKPLILLRVFDVNRDLMTEAKKLGVDQLLIPSLFTDTDEYITYTLRSANEVGLGVIGGFGFMRGRAEIESALKRHSNHPALVGIWFSPRWLPENERTASFIRKLTKIPILVHEWQGAELGDFTLYRGNLYAVKAGDLSKRFVLVGTGRNARLDWQIPVFCALKPRAIVFRADLFWKGGRDTPPVGINEELSRWIQRTVKVRDVFKDTSFSLKETAKDVLEIRGGNYLILLNLSGKVVQIQTDPPGARSLFYAYFSREIIKSSKLKLLLSPFRAYTFSAFPVREELSAPRKESLPRRRELLTSIDQALLSLRKRFEAIEKSKARYESSDRFGSAFRELQVKFRGIKRVEDLGEDQPEEAPAELTTGLPAEHSIVKRAELLKTKLNSTTKPDALVGNEVTQLLSAMNDIANSLLDLSFQCLPGEGGKLDHLRKTLRSESSTFRLVNLSDYPLELRLSKPRRTEVYVESWTGGSSVVPLAQNLLGTPPYFLRLGEFGEILLPPQAERRLGIVPSDARRSVNLNFSFLNAELPPRNWRFRLGEKPILYIPQLGEKPPVRWEKEIILWSKSALTATSPYEEPPSDASVPSFNLNLFREENEDISVLITNRTNKPLDLVAFDTTGLVESFRSTLHTPAHILIQFKQNSSLFSRFERRIPERVNGPLIRLSEPAELIVPPGETRELFVTLSTRSRKGGEYSGEISLVSLNRNISTTLPIEVKVWDIALPDIAPIDIYAWDYSGSNETEFKFLVRNRFNRFMLGFAQFKIEDGKVAIDPEDLEKMIEMKREYGRFVLSYGIVSFFEERMEEIRRAQKTTERFKQTLKEVMDAEEEPEEEKKGLKPDYSFMSELWQKLFAEYVKQIDEVLKSKGLKGDDVVIQVWDEPNDSQAETLARALPIVRRVAPDWVLTTDPACSATARKKLASLIDLWIPHSGSLWGYIFGYRQGSENLKWYKEHGKVWKYTCRTNFHTMDATQYFRLYFLKAWIMGLDGVAVFAASYFDGRGIYPLKTVFGYREGAEDYSALHILKEALKTSKGQSDLTLQAREILRRMPYECIGDDWWAKDPERRTRLLNLWKLRIMETLSGLD